MGVAMTGICDGCYRTCTGLRPKARAFRGDPPAGWPRFQWFCPGCIDNPHRTAEPMAVFPLRDDRPGPGLAIGVAAFVGYALLALCAGGVIAFGMTR